MARHYGQVYCKSDAEVDLMRKAGVILANVFDHIHPFVKEGVTTLEISDQALSSIRKQNAEPLFLGVPSPKRGVASFPAVACISVNEEIVHGIPGTRKLLPGDLVSIDIGVKFKGWCSDAARSFVIPGADNDRMQKVEELRQITIDSLNAGIAFVGPGRKLGEVSEAIERCAKKLNCGIIKELVGHGIGQEMWELPNVPNYRDPSHTFDQLTLLPGMTIAIEPMLTTGSSKIKLSKKDGWTVFTADNSLAAHVEDTVVVTENGVEILSRHPFTAL